MTLRERYEAGESEAVWADIRSGHAADHDAEAVAVATMRRVASNVDRMVGALEQDGYRFAYPDMARSHPTSTDERAVNGLARQLDGAVPLALRSCLAIVGEVWLCGSHPDWSPPTFASDDSAEYPLLADPLVLPPARWVLSELAEWDSDEWVQPKRPWRLGWAPDELHKAGISGSTHDLELPDACPDPVIYGVEGRPGVTLVEYLRTSCRWAGFPGFEFTRTVPPLIDDLRREMLPI